MKRIGSSDKICKVTSLHPVYEQCMTLSSSSKEGDRPNLFNSKMKTLTRDNNDKVGRGKFVVST